MSIWQKMPKIVLSVSLVTVLVAIPFVVGYAQTKPVVSPASSKEPIRIGINLGFTGPMTEVSTQMRKGYEMFLEEVGYEVAGRKVEIIEYDNRSDAKISLEMAKKLVKKDKVHMMAGWVSSGAALSCKSYLIEEKIPMIMMQAASELLTIPGNKYVFRPTIADGMFERPLSHYAYDTIGFRKMVVFCPDYVGGTGKMASFTHGFQEKGGKIIQTILHPWGTYDIAPYFSKISREAEAIFIYEPGDIAIVRFLTQYYESKLKEKLKLCLHPTMAQDYLSVKIFGEQMLGTYSVQLYTPSFASPENDHFKRLYNDKFPEEIPNYYNESGYVAMKFIFAALKSINANIEDQEAFLAAMSSTKIQAPCSMVSLDKNNNVVRDFLITRIEKVGGRVENVVKKVIPQVAQPPQGFSILEKK